MAYYDRQSSTFRGCSIALLVALVIGFCLWWMTGRIGLSRFAAILSSRGSTQPSSPETTTPGQGLEPNGSGSSSSSDEIIKMNRTLYLTDLEPIQQKRVKSITAAKCRGVDYFHSINFDDIWNYLDNSRYSEQGICEFTITPVWQDLKFAVGFPDTQGTDIDGEAYILIRVSGDGRVLLDNVRVMTTDAPVSCDVDVGGVNKLSIVAVHPAGVPFAGGPAILDPTLNR